MTALEVADPSLRFVALGDSTSLGIGDVRPTSRPGGWAARLCEALDAAQPMGGCILANLARNGARAAHVRREQLPWALACRPHVASVVVGGNDVLRGDFAIKRVRADLDTTLAELHSVGATVLVATLPRPGRAVPLPGAVQRVMAARIESINAAFVELARKHGALLLDLANHPEAAQRQSWHIDRIHPGVAGHLILAEGFAALLREVGFRVGPVERTEPAPIEAKQQIGWLLRHGTPWLANAAST